MVNCPCRRRARALNPRHLRDRGKGFIRDTPAVKNISTYDPQCWPFFQSPLVQRILKKKGQAQGGPAMNGAPWENFDPFGQGRPYLDERNVFGGGPSQATYAGQCLLMEGVQPGLSFNGPWGYCPNTPNFQPFPSQFQPPTTHYF